MTFLVNYWPQILYLVILIFGMGMFYNKVFVMEKELKKLDQRMETQFQNIDNKFQNIDNKFQNIDNKFEHKFSEVSNKVTTIMIQLSKQESEFLVLKNNLDSLRIKQAEDTQRLEKRQEKMEDILVKLKDDFHAFSNRLQRFTLTVGTIGVSGHPQSQSVINAAQQEKQILDDEQI